MLLSSLFVNLVRAFVAVMSITSHFIVGRARRCLAIISRMHAREKSMLVTSTTPSSYLQTAEFGCPHAVPMPALNELLIWQGSVEVSQQRWGG